MARTTWKRAEREAAALLGGKRFWANEGGRLDVSSPLFACQVKNPRFLSLAELTRLVEEMAVAGADSHRLPIVCLKRSAGAGRPTPMLVVMPADAWKLLFSFVDCSQLEAALLAQNSTVPIRQRTRVKKYVEKAMKT